MNQSLMKNKYGILLMVTSSFFVCIGQLLWKLSLGHLSIALLFGFLFYGIGAVCMVIAYRFGRLSVLQPILSLSYVFSIILAYAVLHEHISLQKVLGILIIIIGVKTLVGSDT